MNKKDTEKRVQNTLSYERKSIEALNKTLTKDFYDAVETLEERDGKIIITGVGKSGFIGMKIAATLTSLGHGAFFLNPMDALHGDAGMIDEEDVLIALSSSGNTTELLRLIKYAKRVFNIKIIAITGDRDSDLGKLSNHIIQIFINEEGCPLGLAPMASTTASLVVGDLLASALTSPVAFKEKHFARFHPAGDLGLSLQYVHGVMSTGEKVPISTETATLKDVLAEMTDKKSGITGVIDKKGTIIGVITDGDIRRFLVNNEIDQKACAKDMMTTDFKAIKKDETLKVALKNMEQFKITTLFVVEDTAKPIGIVHIHNIIEDVIL